MEERQRQIREGAGLEESRLNVEFIEFLKKYSTPLLLIIAIVAGGYFAYNNYLKRRERKSDEAYSQLRAAVDARNPTTILRVADENPVGAVPLLAHLSAADLHLEAYRTGLPAGTTLGPDGALPAETKPLTAEQRADELKTADSLYKKLHEDAASAGRLDFQCAGLFGQAACAESRGELDAAKGLYQQIIDKSKAAGVPEWASRAEQLKSTVDDFATPPRLVSQAELPDAAKAAAPFTSGLSNVSGMTAGGQRIQVGPDGQIQLVPDGATPPPAAPPPSAPGEPAGTAPAAPTETPAATPPAPATEPAPSSPASPPATPPASGEPANPK